ncbi:hypothetical protein NOGI109294_20785 [Nocardiopsis gilva]
MKNGPPITASTMPTSTSPVPRITRPMMSAMRISTMPHSAPVGTSQRWSEPVRVRAMCGAIRPRKPIGPTAATDAPVSSAMASTPVPRVSHTRWPSDAATSSPSASALSPGALPIASTIPTTRNGSTCQIASVGRPVSEPTRQNRNTSRLCWSSSTMADVTPLSRAVIAAPASTRVTGVGP